MKESVLKHPQAASLIFGGLVEHSLFWEDPHSGIRCKTRPDVWHKNMTVDLKTTASADERSFASSIASFGYHLQSAMNREGIFHNGGNDIITHTFVCVEKEWPYLVAVYILDQNTLDCAHNMFKNTLQQFKECVIRDEWPSYETKEISLPAWAL
jgi:exodeoxyribonuclease VIII